MKVRRGISLIELVLTTALIGLVIQIAYSIFFVGATSYSVSTNKGFSQQDIRLAANLLDSELRYVTDINSQAIYNGEYYSLHLENKDGRSYLVKSKHNYTGDGTEANREDMTTTSEISRVSGNWSNFSLKNDTPGRIDVHIIQTENMGFKESGFEMTQTIDTVNDGSLNSGISIDFVSGNKLYYRNSKLYLLSRGIDINVLEGGTGDGSLVTITFDSDGGSPATDTVTGESGSYVDYPENPTKSGYVFEGWYSQKYGGGEEYTGSQILLPVEDVTIYANWITGISQLTISNEIIVDEDTSPNKDGERYIVNKSTGNSGGSRVKVRLSGYDADNEEYYQITVAGTEVAADENGWITFDVIPPNGSKKTLDITITIITAGHPEVSKTIGFISTN